MSGYVRLLVTSPTRFRGRSSTRGIQPGQPSGCTPKRPRHVSKLLNFAAFLSGSAVADEARKKAPSNTLSRKDKSVPWWSIGASRGRMIDGWLLGIWSKLELQHGRISSLANSTDSQYWKISLVFMGHSIALYKTHPQLLNAGLLHSSTMIHKFHPLLSTIIKYHKYQPKHVSYISSGPGSEAE